MSPGRGAALLCRGRRSLRRTSRTSHPRLHLCRRLSLLGRKLGGVHAPTQILEKILGAVGRIERGASPPRHHVLLESRRRRCAVHVEHRAFRIHRHASNPIHKVSNRLIVSLASNLFASEFRRRARASRSSSSSTAPSLAMRRFLRALDVDATVIFISHLPDVVVIIDDVSHRLVG